MCVPVTLMLEDDCSPGIQEACYSGPEKTKGIGICQAGVKTMLGDCSWGPCDGSQVPIAEKCATVEVDEDCDGDPDNGCVCTPVRWRSAVTPTPRSQTSRTSRSACATGIRTCRRRQELGVM